MLLGDPCDGVTAHRLRITETNKKEGKTSKYVSCEGKPLVAWIVYLALRSGS